MSTNAGQSEFTKCLIHNRFQFGLEQCVNIYMKFKNGTRIGYMLSSAIQERFSIIPKALVLLSLTRLQLCRKLLFFSRAVPVSAASPDFWIACASDRVLRHRNLPDRQMRCLVCESQILTDYVASYIGPYSLYSRVETGFSVCCDPQRQAQSLTLG